ncbi:MAG TPA: hypothetical protein VMZ69_02675, partial [Saprospiraceae bacterium]|nr:hypothetical protein [Saprospiraceae bacterium]
MRILIAIVLLFGLTSLNSCDKKQESGLNCNTIIINQPFRAKITEDWCIGSDWKIHFGPLVEDSRCNVPNIECVWAGRYVMEASIDNGDSVRDTFFAVNNWS